MANEGESPLLQVQNVRHKKKGGVLVLTSARVAWCPEETMDTFVVNHPYQMIKGTPHANYKRELDCHHNLFDYFV